MRIFLFSFVLSVIACSQSTPPPSAPQQGQQQSPPYQQQPQAPTGPCIKTGCSGTVCAEEEVVTTCEFRPEYACYRDAICERQPNGACGFTDSPQLRACLANPPPIQ